MERKDTAPLTVNIKISHTEIAYQFYVKLGTETYAIIHKYKKNFGFPSHLSDGTDIPDFLIVKIYDQNISYD